MDKRHITDARQVLTALSRDAAANRKKFEFGKALGVEVLTADVSPDGFDSVEALCEEFGIKIALHHISGGNQIVGLHAFSPR